MKEPYQWRVSKAQAGEGLLSFLRQHCKEAPSVKAIKRAIDGKRCFVNGQVQTFSSYLLNEKDLVSLKANAFEKEKPLEVSVLYEDEDLLLVHKPSGMLSESIKLAPHLVHRLDKETSGVLILAKRAKVKEQMIALFREHAVHKLYLAIVDGVVEKEEGVIDNHLGKKGEYEGQTIYGKVTKGLRAITRWKCLSRGQTASLLCCEPQTGRTHQLRVHLSGMGHPILGDRQYAKRFRCHLPASRNLLHAYSVTFTHPCSGQPLKVIAPIPLDFKEALTILHLPLKRVPDG